MMIPSRLLSPLIAVALSVGAPATSWCDEGSEDHPDQTRRAELKVPDLEHGVTSFGAAVLDGWLYVYGGHQGDSHHYNAEDQSGSFQRVRIGGTAWESLPSGPKLQGLALVAHGGKLYRIGGFTALNHDDADQDLHSQATVAQFDPQSKKWTELPPLPAPRSSLDAAVLDNKIYVVGGWNMQGDAKTWTDAALVLDLTQQPLAWKEIAKPPFRRRAVAAAAFDGKLYVIGGMREDNKPTDAVDIFDPRTGQWTTGPALGVTGSMSGFGRDATKWETVRTLKHGRFFHRMVPAGKNLLLIAGASMTTGKFDDVAVVPVQ